jgi:hypothetical protein
MEFELKYNRFGDFFHGEEGATVPLADCIIIDYIVKDHYCAIKSVHLY